MFFRNWRKKTLPVYRQKAMLRLGQHGLFPRRKQCFFHKEAEKNICRLPYQKEKHYLYPENLTLKRKIMASRKALKKSVNYIAGELFTECLVNKLYVPGTDPQKADALMGDILTMQDEFLSRISHTEPGNVKGFYKKFRSDFNAKVNEIIDRMGQLK